MIHPDLLVLIVGVFVTFMAVWGGVVYGVLVSKRQRRRTEEAALDPDEIHDERAKALGI